MRNYFSEEKKTPKNSSNDPWKINSGFEYFSFYQFRIKHIIWHINIYKPQKQKNKRRTFIEAWIYYSGKNHRIKIVCYHVALLPLHITKFSNNSISHPTFILCFVQARSSISVIIKNYCQYCKHILTLSRKY